MTSVGAVHDQDGPHRAAVTGTDVAHFDVPQRDICPTVKSRSMLASPPLPEVPGSTRERRPVRRSLRRTCHQQPTQHRCDPTSAPSNVPSLVSERDVSSWLAPAR